MHKLVLISDNQKNNIPEFDDGDIFINDKNELIYVKNMFFYYELYLIKIKNGKIERTEAKPENLINSKLILNVWENSEKFCKISEECERKNINFFEYLIKFKGRGNI